MTCPPLLYLNFDGVLHHANVEYTTATGPVMRAPGQQLFAHAQLLADMLAPYPALRIVLTTRWHLSLGTDEAASLLPDELRKRVIGRLMSSGQSRSHATLNRGAQILEDAANRGATSWLAIDSDVAAFPPEAWTHLVATDPATGLNDPSVIQTLKQKLMHAHAAWSPQ